MHPDNTLLARVNREDSMFRAREPKLLLGALVVLLGAIIIGHNTLYGIDPQLIGVVAHTPAIVIPIVNLLIGLPLVIVGAWILRRNW